MIAPAGAGRVIAREHRAPHASRIPREGIVFREPPDMAGGPVFQRARRVIQPQSLGEQRADYFTVLERQEGPKRPLIFRRFLDCAGTPF